MTNPTGPTFNLTPTCACRFPKEKQFQWCEACWNKIPLKLQDQFKAHAIATKNAIQNCQSAITK